MKTLFLAAVTFLLVQTLASASESYMCSGMCSDDKDIRHGRTVYATTLEDAQAEMERVCGAENVDLDKVTCRSYKN